MNRAAKPVTAKEKAWSVPPKLSLVPSALVCHHGITDSTMVWIKLTTPSGGLIYIILEQVTSIRSDTQVSRSQRSTRFGKREISGRARRCRAGHAVDHGRRSRSREW